MPSLKSIRKRIVSVKNTQKITRATKMVAAARLRRAQEQTLHFRPYVSQLQRMVLEVLQEERNSEDKANGQEPLREGRTDSVPAEQPENRILESTRVVPLYLYEERPLQRVRLVLLSSDRGLVGAFNSNLYRRLEQWLVENPGVVVELEVCGRKGIEYVKRRLRDRKRLGTSLLSWEHVELQQTHPGIDSKQVIEKTRVLAQSWTAAFQAKQIDAVYVLYNHFHNAARQTVELKRFLPIVVPKSDVVSVSWVYEPNRQTVVEQLLPAFLEAEIMRMGLENIASELGAQMTAMDNASRNAKEMIADLTLQLNRVRQALITKELMEIIGGAEALQG